MRKNLFSSLLVVLILFWVVGTTSYSQEKTEKELAKTENVVKKTTKKANTEKEKVKKVSVSLKKINAKKGKISKASTAKKKVSVKKESYSKSNMASKHRMLHKHYMNSAKNKMMKEKKKTDSMKKKSK